jgi:hypothetical protein
MLAAGGLIDVSQHPDLALAHPRPVPRGALALEPGDDVKIGDPHQMTMFDFVYIQNDFEQETTGI